MLSATRKAFTTLPNVASKATYATATQAVQISTAQNGIKVASVEDASQTAGLSIIVNGGARLENGSNAGVAHYLKNYGFKNTTKRTAFRIAREAELAGAVLSSNLTHESLVFSAEFLKEDAELAAELLGDVVSNQKFQPHEFVDLKKQTAHESIAALANPEIAAIEAAHKTAFRSGLGNSIFARSTNKITNDTVKAFAGEAFTQGNITLVGTGLDVATVERLASTYIQVPAGQSISQASKYFGGESRVDTGAGAGSYILAFEGAAANTSEFVATQVLQQALGGAQSSIVSPVSGIFGQTLTKLAEGTQLKAFNFGYSDAGLFGVYVSAASTDATASAIAAAAEQLKALTNGLSAEDFQRAVAQAKFATAASYNTRLDRLETIGAQVQSGKVASASEVAAAFDKLAVADVIKVAQQVLKSKPTTVAVGDIYNLPYADSISL